jgi:uncharacterized protein YfaQ (DUF2300 family)
MSKFNNSRVFIAAAAFVTVAALSAFSFGGSAEAAGNPLSCQGKTAAKVVACCEQLTKDHRPFWMRSTGISCREAVRCKFKLCRIEITYDNHYEGETDRK